MKKVAITEDTINEFAHYLGEDIAENVGREFIKGVALVDAKDSVRAAMLWELKNSENPKKDTVSNIMFLKFEDMEAGEELLERYRECANMDDVRATRLELAVSDADAVRLFLARGYDVEEAKSIDLNVRLSDFKESPVFQKALSGYVKPLKDLDIRTFRSTMEHIRPKSKGIAVEDIDYLPMDWFEQDISCYAFIENKIEGVLLIHRTPSGILRPEALFAGGGDDQRKMVVNLMRFGVDKAYEIYPPDTQVTIRRSLEDIRVFTDMVFEDCNGENVFSCSFRAG